jgi:hypothetical protein
MRSLTLKTVVVTAALAAGSAFGAEAGPPFEVTEFNRTLPNVPQRIVAQPASGDRVVVAASGQASGGSTGARLATGVWANDHNFIAPPQ